MSERTLNQQNGAQNPAFDEVRLSDHRAPAPSTTPGSTSSANLDLANLSIETSSVVRLSPRPEKRSTATERLQTQTATKSTATAEARKTPPKRFGIFKNPCYKYEGGPLGILISFLANILKVLEQLLLRPRIVAPQVRPRTQSLFPLPQTEKKRKTKEEEEREETTPSLPRLS